VEYCRHLTADEVVDRRDREVVDLEVALDHADALWKVTKSLSIRYCFLVLQ
jgi:hypothetical protein